MDDFWYAIMWAIIAICLAVVITTSVKYNYERDIKAFESGYAYQSIDKRGWFKPEEAL